MPEEPYAIPFGEANVVREGDDVTIVALGRMVQLAAAGRGRARGRGHLSARSSTRARPRRWTSETILESVGEHRAGSSWSTRPTRAAASPPTSSALVAQEGVRRPQGAAADGDRRRTRPVPFTPGARGRSTCPSAATRSPPRVREVAGDRRRRRAMSAIAEARHAQVGPVDDRGARSSTGSSTRAPRSPSATRWPRSRPTKINGARREPGRRASCAATSPAPAR